MRPPRFDGADAGAVYNHVDAIAIIVSPAIKQPGRAYDQFVTGRCYDRQSPVRRLPRPSRCGFEVNAFGTIYEVFFIWEEEYEKAGYGELPEFARDADGVLPFDGVGFKPHPRGKRIGYWNWDFPGLQSAVHVDGTINDNSDRDRGWTVELALPWQGMKTLAMPDGRALPPRDGDVWRMDFSRFNQYREAPPNEDSGAWFWSAHGTRDSHVPEVYPYIHFSTRDVAEAGA